MHTQGKDLVCTQDLPHKRLGESKNAHLEQSKSGSAFSIVSLDVITLIYPSLIHSVDTCWVKLQLHPQVAATQ